MHVHIHTQQVEIIKHINKLSFFIYSNEIKVSSKNIMLNTMVHLKNTITSLVMLVVNKYCTIHTMHISKNALIMEHPYILLRHQ